MHQKVNVLNFVIYAQKWQFRKKIKSKFDYSLAFIFSPPQKRSLNIFHYNNNSPPWAPTFYFLPEQLFWLSHMKNVGPSQS